MNRLITLFGLSLLPALAFAVPLQVAQQGRMMDAEGVPLEGERTLTFALFEEEAGGENVWIEDIQARFQNGYYSVILGTDETDNPLDGELLANYPLYLELTIEDGAPLTPRHSLVSVPYAIAAEEAERANTAVNVDGGTVNASSVSVGGNTVIDDTGHWVGAPVEWNDVVSIPDGFADDEDNDLLASLACDDGELLAWSADDKEWLCVFDADSLADISCADGELLLWDTDTGFWDCGEDIDTLLTEAEVETYITNAAINLYAGSTVDGNAILSEASDLDWVKLINIPSGLDDGDDDTLGDVVCSDGQYVVWDATSGLWDCGDDADALAALSCTDGELPIYSASSGWGCGTDTDTTLTAAEVQAYVEAVGGLALASGATVGGDAILTDTSNLDWSNLMSIPADIDDGDDDTLDTVVCADGQYVMWDASSGLWDCGDDADALADLACADGDVAIYSASTGWDCGADTDTTLTAAEVQTYIEGMSGLNLDSSTQVSGNSILTVASNVDWAKLINIPSDLSDGDDDALAALSCTGGDIPVYTAGSGWGCGTDTDTTLTAAEVQSYIEAMSALKLSTGTTLNGDAMLTVASNVDWAKLINIPSDLSDGDDDALAALSCTGGDIPVYTAGRVWRCGTDTDSTLSAAEVQSYIEAMSALKLSSGTTLNGDSILTVASNVDWAKLINIPSDLSDGDDDALAALSCTGGDIPVYTAGSGWGCGTDTDTTLSAVEVQAYVEGASGLALKSGVTVGGYSALTSASSLNWGRLTGIPSDLMDGDDILTEAQVENFITNGAVNLASGSSMDGDALMTTADSVDWTKLTNIPSDLSDGDDDTLGSLSCASDKIAVFTAGSGWGCGEDTDTNLTTGEVKAYVEGMTGLALRSGTTVGGRAILTDASNVAWGKLTGIPADFADSIDDDTLADLICTNGQNVVWDSSSGGWDCGDDADTQLTEADVETYITNGVLDFASGSTLGGKAILTEDSTLDWGKLTNIPSELSDGDDDTLGDLSCSDGEVPQYDSSAGDWGCMKPSASAAPSGKILFGLTTSGSHTVRDSTGSWAVAKTLTPLTTGNAFLPHRIEYNSSVNISSSGCVEGDARIILNYTDGTSTTLAATGRNGTKIVEMPVDATSDAVVSSIDLEVFSKSYSGYSSGLRTCGANGTVTLTGYEKAPPSTTTVDLKSLFGLTTSGSHTVRDSTGSWAVAKTLTPLTTGNAFLPHRIEYNSSVNISSSGCVEGDARIILNYTDGTSTTLAVTGRNGTKIVEMPVDATSDAVVSSIDLEVFSKSYSGYSSGLRTCGANGTVTLTGYEKAPPTP